MFEPNLKMSTSTKLRTCVIKPLLASICLLITLEPAAAQSNPNPASEELLNGLRVLFWPKPGSTDVLVKLRIHSGSSFDLAGKSGEMALLGDILFPNPETNEFFTEQVGGKLHVAVNYDSITITMAGKADQLNNILDVLRNAILSTQLTPDIVERVREARVKLVEDAAVSPAVIADRALAARLFDNFPYGRPSGGSPEDLKRVGRGDLMLARERFLNSNNATLAISGGITQAKVVRTLKQLFGPWRRSEEIVPATFSAAPTPDPRTLIVDNPGTSVEVRVGLRGVARSDKDFHALKVLTRVMQNRWPELNPAIAGKPSFVRSESYLLPGSVVMGTTVSPQSTAEVITSAKKVLEAMITTPVTVSEIEKAKQGVILDLTTQTPRSEVEVQEWLDMYTYRLKTAQDNVGLVQTVTPGDLQRVASRLFKDARLATVVVGDAQVLKTALQGQLPFEVLGETPEKAMPTKPATKPSQTNAPD